ncbi:MAG: hypothetical protein U0223_11720 [Nitrospira sp.]|nr:hypothetical protein [Nitrospira sp.]
MISALKACLKTLPVLLFFVSLGCVTPVTPEQITNADYGTVSPTYQDSIKKYMEGVLFDPYSAHYRFFGEPAKGYAYLSGTIHPPTFGYLVHVGINAKNRMGGYVGEQPYRFFLKNDQLWILHEYAKAEVVR